MTEPTAWLRLKEHFGEATLTEENLAEWKDSGHPEWLRQQQTAEKARLLAEHAQDPARHRATLQRFNLSTPGIGRKSTLIKANQA